MPDVTNNMNDYDRDFYAWTQTQSVHLRRRDPQQLDWDNLAEEEDSGINHAVVVFDGLLGKGGLHGGSVG